MISAESEGEATFGYPSTPAGALYLWLAVAATSVSVGVAAGSSLSASPAVLTGVLVAAALYVADVFDGVRAVLGTGALLGGAAVASAAAWGVGGGFSTPSTASMAALVVAAVAFAPYAVEGVDVDDFRGASKSVNAAAVAAAVIAVVVYLSLEGVGAVVFALAVLPSALAWGVGELHPALAVGVVASAPAAALYVFYWNSRFAVGVGLISDGEFQWARELFRGLKKPFGYVFGGGFLIAAVLGFAAVAPPVMAPLAAVAYLPASLGLAWLAVAWTLDSLFSGGKRRSRRLAVAAVTLVSVISFSTVAALLHPELPTREAASLAGVFYDAFAYLLVLAAAMLVLRGLAASGVTAGPRNWAGVGVAALFAAAAFSGTGATAYSSVAVFAAVASAVVSWDVVENSVGHAEAGGWSWRSARSESLHLVAGALVAAAAVLLAAAGYALLSFAPESPARPVAAVAAAFAVAAFVWVTVK